MEEEGKGKGSAEVIAEVLRSIPPLVYHAGMKCDNDCVICMAPVEVGDKVRALSCRHIFHSECLDEWLVWRRVCPLCGLKFMEFRISGRLGCPNDYLAFNRGLLPLLRRSHDGVTRHVGKFPKRPAGPESADALRLRAQLRQAVSREEYEEAARLRDQLRPKDATP